MNVLTQEFTREEEAAVFKSFYDGLPEICYLRGLLEGLPGWTAEQIIKGHDTAILTAYETAAAELKMIKAEQQTLIENYHKQQDQQAGLEYHLTKANELVSQLQEESEELKGNENKKGRENKELSDALKKAQEQLQKQQDENKEVHKLIARIEEQNKDLEALEDKVQQKDYIIMVNKAEFYDILKKYLK